MSEQYKKFSDIYEEELAREQERAARWTSERVGDRLMSSLANPILRDYEKMASRMHSARDALRNDMDKVHDMAYLKVAISDALDDAIRWDNNIGLFEDMRQTKELLRLLMARCPGRSTENLLDFFLTLAEIAIVIVGIVAILVMVPYEKLPQLGYYYLGFALFNGFICWPAISKLYQIIKDKIINGKIIPEGRIIFYEQYRALIFDLLNQKVNGLQVSKFEYMSDAWQDVFKKFCNDDCVKRHEIIKKAKKECASIKRMHNFFDDFKKRESIGNTQEYFGDLIQTIKKQITR